MDLDYNSTTAKIYRWFYGTEKMPKSGCTYWRKAIFAYLLLIPTVCFCLPVLFFEKRNNFEDNNPYIWKYVLSCVFYFCLYCLFSIGYAIYCFYNHTHLVKDSWEHATCALGAYWIVVGGAVGVVCSISYLTKKIIGRKKDKETKPNIIIEFVKTKYNKICPTLNWINKD